MEISLITPDSDLIILSMSNTTIVYKQFSFDLIYLCLIIESKQYKNSSVIEECMEKCTVGFTADYILLGMFH